MIVHQTWGSVPVPEPYAKYRRHIAHPTRLWVDQEMREFVRDTYGMETVTAYDAMPLDVHRWDSFRYYLLYSEGGAYLDMDMEPTASFTPLMTGELVLCSEHPTDAWRMGRRSMLSNAVFFTRPQHPFFNALIEALHATPPTGTTRRSVIRETGPGFVTRVYRSADYEARVLPHTAFYPNSLFTPFAGVGEYATHRFASTWWSQCSDKETP
jgi:mannosyltransferase OCH1-like enzyme